MGVLPGYSDGLTVAAANTGVAGANPIGLNNAFGDSLSLTGVNLLTGGSITAQTVTGPLTLNGAITLNAALTKNAAELGHVTLVSSAGPYAVLSTDRYIVVTYTSAITITLPVSPVSGRLITVKSNASTGAGTAITITGSQAIDGTAGATGIVLNNAWGSVDLLYQGSLWVIL